MIIRWVFYDNLKDNFPYFSIENMLWVLIKLPDSNEYPQHML